MNKTFKTIAMIAVMAVAAVSAQASVTYSGIVLGPQDNAGNFITDGTLVLVMDLDGDGWDGTAYDAQADSSKDNASSWSWDADDFVVTAPIIENQGVGVGQVLTIMSDFPTTYDAGIDDWYVLWFDAAFDVASAGPGEGVAYGALLAGKLKTNPANATFQSQFPGMATLVTVPEPASMLVLLGGSVLALRRRRA